MVTPILIRTNTKGLQMAIVIEKISQEDLEAIRQALSAIPQGRVGTLETIRFDSFQKLNQNVKVKLYLERDLGNIIQNYPWTADFEDKAQCDIEAQSLGYRSFFALQADTRIKFVEKIIIA